MKKAALQKKKPSCSNKRKTIEDKILSFLSSPRKGIYSSARAIAHYTRDPLEHVEFAICKLSDEGVVNGVKDSETGDFLVENLWMKD